MSELVYRKPCEHGRLEKHWVYTTGKADLFCNGPVEQVLAPDKVLIDDFDYEIRVSDVLAVLDGEDT